MIDLMLQNALNRRVGGCQKRKFIYYDYRFFLSAFLADIGKGIIPALKGSDRDFVKVLLDQL